MTRQALVYDSIREDLYQAGIRSLLEMGQRRQGLALYEQCARVLDEELGVEPSDETKALGRRLRTSTGRSPDSA